LLSELVFAALKVGARCMGCCAAPASGGGAVKEGHGARQDPEIREVTFNDGSTMLVGLASDSLAYSLLVADSQGAVFIDVRGHASYDHSHLHGAWCVDAPSMAGRSCGPSSEDRDQASDAALRQRCSLRTVVICGGQTSALREEEVLCALQLLQRVNARPKGHPLVLRGGVPAFSRRFSFCMRCRGGEKSQPLPPCPVEVLAPGLSRSRPPAVYVGTDRCFSEAGTEKVLAALGIRAILHLGQKAAGPSRAKCRMIHVRAASNDAPSIAAAACEKLKRQTAPCLLCGHAAALAAALLLAEALPAVAKTAGEVDVYIKLRLPTTEFDAVAHDNIMRAIAKVRSAHNPAGAAESLSPSALALPPPETTSTPVAPPSGNAAPPATYVEQLCRKLLARDRRNGEVALSTVRAAFTHILEQPTESKFRRLKGSNARVQREILVHQEVVMLLRVAGFVGDGEDLVLPPTMPLQGLRDILAQMPPVAKTSDSK